MEGTVLSTQSHFNFTKFHMIDTTLLDLFYQWRIWASEWLKIRARTCFYSCRTCNPCPKPWHYASQAYSESSSRINQLTFFNFFYFPWAISRITYFLKIIKSLNLVSPFNYSFLFPNLHWQAYLHFLFIHELKLVSTDSWFTEINSECWICHVIIIIFQSSFIWSPRRIWYFYHPLVSGLPLSLASCLL